MVFYVSIVGEVLFFAKYLYRMRLFNSNSLKDKRSFRSSIIRKIQNKYNIAVAEVGDQDVHNSLFLACANVSYDKCNLEKTYYSVLDLIENYDLEVYETDYVEY